MMRRALVGFALLIGCGTRFGAVYPPRPPSTPGGPLADPAPTRMVAHVTVTGAALRSSLDDSVPKTGEGTFRLLGTDRKYRWSREPLALAFTQGRLALDTHVTANVDLPLTTTTIPMDLRVLAEPIVSTEYAVRIQSTEVKATSTDRRLKIADSLTGVLDVVSKEIDAKVKDFRYDLRPLVSQAYDRVKAPFEFPLGEAKGCAELRVLGVEAGPTILADGLEKDLALVVAPQVTLPCTPAKDPAELPPLANVATLVPGPFTVTVPIAARYDELSRAMGMTFTDGKYFFSQEYPGLYLSEPEVYASDDKLVLRLRIRGPVKKLGLEEDLDGDLFLSGRPTLSDNELTIPDLEPTIETRSFLLKLKAMTDSDRIRDDARRALRLNLSERFAGLREQLASSLSFGDEKACFQGAIDKLEVTGIHPHGTYMRVTVGVTGRARLSMPCAPSSAAAKGSGT
jgi:hypothetical protein